MYVACTKAHPNTHNQVQFVTIPDLRSCAFATVVALSVAFLFLLLLVMILVVLL